MKSLSIIIPTYNEEKTILLILKTLKKVELLNEIKKEIIVVNDFSTDNTEFLVKDFISTNPNFNLKYFKHEKNKGKGAALHTGIKNATGDYIVVQDADMEYDPNEFNNLLNQFC